MASAHVRQPPAGPSKPRPPPISVLTPQDCLAPKTSNVRTRTPTRAPTDDQGVELGVYLAQEAGTPPVLASASPSKTGFSFYRRPSASSASEPHKSKSPFLANSEWRTDIVTFCSHARVDSALGQARITHVQARKSRRPPFLHEYLLVFFTTSTDQRFVMRIDRLGKIGSTFGGGLLGWCAGRHGQASNIAIQQVGVYHIQDAQIDIDSSDGAWCACDGGWGSEPIATLIIWSDVNTTTTQVSHHTQTATARDGPIPRLSDVSRLLEAILLEMPTYHLTTTNCYFMTRSSILLLQRCFPNSFACFMGSVSGKLIASSELAEPVWAGLVRWYLPFVVTMFALYLPLVILGHCMMANVLACQKIRDCPIHIWPTGSTYWFGLAPLPRVTQGLRLATHGIIDVPLPIGILHAWMTTLEVRMNDLVTRLSAEYHELERGVSGSTLLVEPQPFGVASERAWLTFAAWCGIGLCMALLIFIAMVSNPWVIFGLFMASVVIAVVFNFQYSDGDLLLNPENMFPVYSSEPVSEPVPGPSSSQVAPSQ